jgi:glycosyltransferase involved in cell wall biosynthesis
MRVLGVFIANGFASEARVAATLFRHRAGRYEPLVFHHSWQGDRESAARFEAESAARVFRFDAGWRPNPRADRALVFKVASWGRLHLVLPRLLLEARRFRADAVYSSQQLWDCYAAGWISRLLGIPQIIHLHSRVSAWLRWTTLLQLRRCERVVVVSDFVRREALGHGVRPEAVKIVGNPIQIPPPLLPEQLEKLRRELRLEPGQPVAAIVGRVDAGKGHDDTLAAFAAVAATLPRARLLVAGDGPLLGEVEAKVIARGLGDKVQLLGHRKDVDQILALADVFIHPSLQDSCPLAVLEASAAGKPVVAYADGGIPEIVAGGETGLLVPTGDRGALADALLRLLADPALARRMGTAGRERMVSGFRAEVAGARFAEVVEGLQRAGAAEPSPDRFGHI